MDSGLSLLTLWFFPFCDFIRLCQWKQAITLSDSLRTQANVNEMLLEDELLAISN